LEPQHTPDWSGSHSETQERARAALARQDELRPRNPDRGPRKAEDTSAGCLAMAEGDRARALADGNERMKLVLERSADAWEKRGIMFKRLETRREAKDDG
jgi:hypothetical protein